MDAQAVYRKSEKGSEAIATRGHGVGGKLRMLLILVDGRKTVGELGRMAAGMGESAELLQQLLSEGLIELATAAVAAGTPAAGPAQAVAGDLSQVKPLATRLRVELLGPAADGLAMRIEASKDVPQFVEAMKRAYVTVRDIKGQAAADRFGAEVEAQMPPA